MTLRQRRGRPHLKVVVNNARPPLQRSPYRNDTRTILRGLLACMVWRG